MCVAYARARWVARVGHETDGRKSWVVTLTYGGSVEPGYDEVQKAVKRMRKAGLDPRYFAVVERGSLRGRWHCHMIVTCDCTRRALEKHWSAGFNKCTALSSAGSGAAIGGATAGVPGALVGGAFGLASSLLGGLFGKHNTDKTNEWNYRIMQEQNKFNSIEAQKNREWQELMYRMYGTSSAKANDLRAAGLNALLGDVSASGNVGSGGAASAAESAQMLPTDYSFVSDATYRGLAAYNSVRSVDASVSLQKSQENVNKSLEGVNSAQEGLLKSQNDMQKMTYKFALDTYQNRLLQEQFKAELANWQGFDAMYDARMKAFSLYNVMPQEVEKNVAQTMSFYASAFRDIAEVS